MLMLIVAKVLIVHVTTPLSLDDEDRLMLCKFSAIPKSSASIPGIH